MSKPSIHHLKNGTPLLLVPESNTESLTLTVFVRVGSRYETQEVNGASHFVEHLMFKSTKRRPNALLISKELDRYGAEFNAFTGKELTAFYIKIDAAQTLTAMDLLSDMLFHSRFDEKEIERERGVILEEINMYEDNPRMHIEDLLEATLFPHHPLGWNIAGPREVIRHISRQTLMDFHHRHYLPSRLLVVMAGRIPANALKLTERFFGAQQKTGRELKIQAIPFAQTSSKRRIGFQIKKTEQAQLAIAFHGLPYADPRLPAASLLATILGGSMSSRLFTEVREKRGLCYAIHAHHETMKDTGIFSVGCGLERARAKEAVTVIWKELKKMGREGVRAGELQEAKDHVRGKLKLALEDSAAQGDWYGRHWLFQGRLLHPSAWLKRMDRVQPKEISALAKELFQPARAASAVIGPFDGFSEIDYLFPAR